LLTFNSPASGRLNVELTGNRPFIAGQGGGLLTARFKILDAPSSGNTINVGITDAELTTANGTSVPVTTSDGQVIVTDFGSQVSVK
jgi:hypothetical protein